MKSIELSLEKLELCPQKVLAIWPYGAIKVSKSTVMTPPLSYYCFNPSFMNKKADKNLQFQILR